MRKLSFARTLFTAVFTTTLLAPLACGHEHRGKECADRCAEAERICNGHHERDCGDRAHRCLEECEH